ncbi:MAG: TPM domain-containing protein [Lachnospiraceae bacterium]|nr:TPM domain-containing protein [Lachnospiraceae bacterium]
MKKRWMIITAAALMLGLSYPSYAYADETDIFDEENSMEDDSEDTGVVSGTQELPAWYPGDVSAFVPFHDDNARRVVDDAGIIPDEDEARIEQRLNEIRSGIDKDLVIYTDVSSYGMEQSVLAADFFDFNGYGCGSEYEGACLFVCMDPNDRGWWVACTGSETRRLYTEEFANDMDDALYEYMAAGDYAAGIEDWIENFNTLYIKGRPFAPDWLPDQGEEPERTHNAENPRIDDRAGILTDAEIKSLTDQAEAITDKYGIDVVIHTSNSAYGMDISEYAEKYYRYNGYGLGDDYDGILLTMVYNKGDTSSINTFYYNYFSGAGYDRLTDTNHDRLNSIADNKVRLATSGSEAAGMSYWLSQVEHMERTGRVSRSVGYWIWITIFGSGCGAAMGAGKLKGAKKKMAVPALKESADAYLVANSLKITGKDRFINSRTERRYRPVKTTSDSSSSGSSGRSSGRSSYSSSYSGSSGRTHSGSGRKF